MSDFSDNANLFPRLLHVQAIKGSPEYARAQYGPQSRIARLAEKALAIGTQNLGDDPDLTAAQRGFIGLLRHQSVIAQIGAVSGFWQVAPETPALVQTGVLQASWSGEGLPVSVAMADFQAQRLPVRRLGVIVPCTRETLEGAGAQFEAALTRQMTRAVGALESGSFLDPANSGSAETPSSITNGIAPVAGSGDPRADIEALIAVFQGDLSTAVLVTTPRGALALHGAGFEGAGVRGGDVAGIPQVTNRACPAGATVLVDPARVLLTDGGVEFALSESATLTGASGESLSLYQTNLKAIRAVRYLNWQALPGAVALVSGAAWA